MNDLPVFRRLRRLWLAFVLVVLGILLVLPVLDLEPSEVPLALTATLATAGGAAALIAIVALDLTFAAGRPTDDTRALREFEARVTLGLAIAQAPAVLGFALAFVFGQLVPAAIGGAFALLCLLRGRPTPGRLERLEASWQAAGHDVSALRAARQEAAARPPGATQPPDLPPPDDEDSGTGDPR